MSARTKPVKLGPFARMSPRKLKRLIAKGADDARALDERIRSQFTLGPEATLVLR